MKPGYKLTEVGVIPDDWEIRAVSEKGRVTTGKALAVDAPGKPRRYLRTKNVMDGHIVLDDVLCMPMTDEQFALFEVRSGDVLLNEGQSLELVGRCAMYRGELGEPCAIQNQLIRFRAYDEVSPHFATHLFRHCQQSGVFAKIALQTTSIAHLGGVRFARLNLAWPKTQIEQDAIAEVLSDADSLASALSHLIAKKRGLKQAAMQQLLTGQTRLPGFYGEWEARRLDHAGRCLRGVTYRGDTDLFPHDTAASKRLLRANNIQAASLELRDVQYVRASCVSDAQLLQQEDILICMANGSKDLVGKAALFSNPDGSPYTFGAFVGCFRTDSATADARFVFALLQSAEYRKMINNLLAGSSINNLRPSAVESLMFCFPELDEQRAIARVLGDVDREISALEARRDKTLALKQAMMQELLIGRTRLV